MGPPIMLLLWASEKRKGGAPVLVGRIGDLKVPFIKGVSPSPSRGPIVAVACALVRASDRGPVLHKKRMKKKV